MQILHVNNEKSWRGGERQTLLTALEQRRQGLDSRIACRRGSPLEEMAQAEGVPTISLSNAMPMALLTLARAARSCDVLHCHTGRAHSLGLLATLLQPKPLVISRRTDFPPPKSRFNHWKYRHADKVVCVCKRVANVLLNWGMPAEKISVIYEAVPGEGCLPRNVSLQYLREQTGLAGDKKIIGNIAVLVPDKDQATLLRAAKVVASRRSDVAFVIAGDGRLKEPLLELRKQLGLTNTVFFTGFIPQAQKYMSGFDVFAMSSSNEGFCTIILDAALAGVPVAATAGGGIPENVLHEQTGLLVPVGDASALAEAILRLLDDASLAERLTRTAKQRVETEFSVSSMARHYVEVYQEVLACDAKSTMRRI